MWKGFTFCCFFDFNSINREYNLLVLKAKVEEKVLTKGLLNGVIFVPHTNQELTGKCHVQKKQI